MPTRTNSSRTNTATTRGSSRTTTSTMGSDPDLNKAMNGLSDTEDTMTLQTDSNKTKSTKSSSNRQSSGKGTEGEYEGTETTNTHAADEDEDEAIVETLDSKARRKQEKHYKKCAPFAIKVQAWVRKLQGKKFHLLFKTSFFLLC